VPELIDRGK